MKVLVRGLRFRYSRQPPELWHVLGVGERRVGSRHRGEGISFLTSFVPGVAQVAAANCQRQDGNLAQFLETPQMAQQDMQIELELSGAMLFLARRSSIRKRSRR